MPRQKKPIHFQQKALIDPGPQERLVWKIRLPNVLDDRHKRLWMINNQ